MKTQEIQFGSAATVSLLPPECIRECLGAPSLPTATVLAGYATNDGTPEFTPTVTVDSVSTTTDGDAGYSQTNRKLVPLTATTSIVVGGVYLLTNATGLSEAVEVKEIASGVSVTTVTDLQYDYASGSTFKGIRLTFTVDSTWANTTAKLSLPGIYDYRVRWAYTVASVARYFTSYLRLVRKPFRSSLTYQDVVARWPDLLATEPRDYRGEKFRRMIAEAEAVVRSDVIASGLNPEQLADTEHVDRLVNYALDYQIARFHCAPRNRDHELFIAETKKEYGELFTRVIDQLHVQVEDLNGATSKPHTGLPFWGR